MTKTIQISDDLHKRLRIEAVNADKTLQELVEEKLNDK